MKKFVIQVVILIIIIFAAMGIYTQQSFDSIIFPQRLSKGEVIIGLNKLNVEIADTTNTRNKGLGGRESLASDSGMLFIFEEPKSTAFWMKGVRFPLDIIWIRDNTIVDIVTNIPPAPPNVRDEDLPQYLPNQPIDKVLEVNAGFVEQNNIQIGDQIQIIREGTN